MKDKQVAIQTISQLPEDASMAEIAEELQIMAAIRAPKLNIPDYVEKPLAAVITRALSPDLKTRFKTAGEFAGPLFGYALDQNLLPSQQETRAWLESVLGILA